MEHKVEQQSRTKKEATVLNIVCWAGATAFIAFAAFNAVTSGDFLTTDNLFVTLVCLLFALVFAATPLLALLESGKLPLPFKKKALVDGAAPQLLSDGSLSEAEPAEEPHIVGSSRMFMIVWGGLLILTGIEILLGYKPMPIQFMLTILLGLSIIKAALIVAYFMHLKFERVSLILTVVPMLVICICLFFVFFPDSFRSQGLRYKFKEPPPVPAEKTDEP